MRKLLQKIQMFVRGLQMGLTVREALFFAAHFKPFKPKRVILSEDGTRILNWDEIMEELSRTE